MSKLNMIQENKTDSEKKLAKITSKAYRELTHGERCLVAGAGCMLLSGTLTGPLNNGDTDNDNRAD
ncbi:MAG: hypothetical protein ACD_21C00263G0001 [uncultured bacterium]|nr:MAG: hypothetical protein ACD_21C00263G0001 [uncultured bacterium]